MCKSYIQLTGNIRSSNHSEGDTTGKTNKLNGKISKQILLGFKGVCISYIRHLLHLDMKSCSSIVFFYFISPYVVKYYGSYFKNTDLWVIIIYTNRLPLVMPT